MKRFLDSNPLKSSNLIHSEKLNIVECYNARKVFAPLNIFKRSYKSSAKALYALLENSFECDSKGANFGRDVSQGTTLWILFITTPAAYDALPESEIKKSRSLFSQQELLKKKQEKQ